MDKNKNLIFLSYTLQVFAIISLVGVAAFFLVYYIKQKAQPVKAIEVLVYDVSTKTIPYAKAELTSSHGKAKITVDLLEQGSQANVSSYIRVGKCIREGDPKQNISDLLSIDSSSITVDELRQYEELSLVLIFPETDGVEKTLCADIGS